jgi:hypothetical protein
LAEAWVVESAEALGLVLVEVALAAELLEAAWAAEWAEALAMESEAVCRGR